VPPSNPTKNKPSKNKPLTHTSINKFMRVGIVMVEQFDGSTQAFIPSELVQDGIVARQEKKNITGIIY